MGTAASSFYEEYTPSWWSSRRKARLIIDGISPAGKTSLLYRMQNPKWKRIVAIPTIGFNVEAFNFDGHEITGWDLGGRDKVRPLNRHYYRGADALIYVEDSTEANVGRMEYSRDEFTRIINDEQLDGVPVLLFCNKQDLPDARTPAEIADFFNVSDHRKHGRDHFITIQGGSALQGFGVEEGVKKLCQALAPELEDNEGKPTNVQDKQRGGRAQTATKDTSFVERSNNLCVKRFKHIQNSTECPFAKAAKIWGGNSLFRQVTPIEDQATEHTAPLIEFCHRAKHGEKLDGFCIDLDDERARNGDPKELGEVVRRMLTALADMDPSGENAMRVSYVGSSGWRFRFAKTDFFVTTFAPCYPETSSRYAFRSGRAFILLQPELSFQRHDLPFDSAHTNWDNPQTIRDRTRIAFRDAGRAYHIPKSTKYPMAEHNIVKPLEDDGINVVCWWRFDMLTNMDLDCRGLT